MRDDCLSQRRCCARYGYGRGGVGESSGLLQLDVEGEVGVALKVPSTEGTMVTQKVEVDCRSVVAAAGAAVVVW